MKEKKLRYYLLIIECLVFVIPFLIIFYIFSIENIFSGFSQMILVALTLFLVLAGLIILRQIFDRFSLVATTLDKAEKDEKALVEVQHDTTELHKITGSFNNLMNRLEVTTTALEHRLFDLFTIKELIEVASRSLDIDELLDMLLEKSMAVSGAQTGSILMIESNSRFRVVTSRWLEPGPEKGSLIQISDTLLQNIVYEKKSLLVQDIESDPRTQKSNDPKYGTPSFLSMPIFIKNDLVGVLNLSHKQDQKVFDSQDEHIVSIMIGEMGFALENASLHEQAVEHMKNLQQNTVELKNANKQLQDEIAERKKLEEKLEDTNTFLKNIFDSSTSISIIYTDFEQNILLWNKGAENIFGYSAEEMVGRQKIGILYPDKETKEMVNVIKSSIVKDKKNITKELQEITKSGRSIWVNLNLNPTYDEKGNVIGILGIGEDITERKRQEKEKQRLKTQLQRSQKMEAIGTLAGGVAHDLNNILAGLVSYPELLLMDLPEDSPLRKKISTIQKSGEKAAAIVQDLLTLARRGVAITEAVNLNTIIYDYLMSTEYRKLKEFNPHVIVETDLEKDLLNILGSSVHLSKSLMNLISNAAEAMPDGGEIHIVTENRYIDRPIRGYDNVEQGDYVTLTVADTGIGISSEDMEKIFEPFYTKKKMGRSGTGLGMAVVWGTVKDHNGYIDAQSRKGKGTTFTLYFPVTRKELATEKVSVSIEDYTGKGETILVIDDVKEQREIASQMLTKLGYVVTSVASGEEAVAYLKDNTVDLLVLDMIMDPGIDGLETYKRILAFHPHQKAIIASGFSETKRAKDAQKLGSGAYVKKPYTLEKIGLAVREELGRE